MCPDARTPRRRFAGLAPTVARCVALAAVTAFTALVALAPRPAAAFPDGKPITLVMTFPAGSIRLARHQMRCVAILPGDHPLATRRSLGPRVLSPFPMVAPARALQIATKVFAAFAQAGVSLKVAVEAELFASICAMVAAGAGWSIVDPLSAQRFAHLGLVTRPFEPAIHYEIGVFHPRDREPSVLAAAFLDLIEAELTP